MRAARPGNSPLALPAIQRECARRGKDTKDVAAVAVALAAADGDDLPTEKPHSPKTRAGASAGAAQRGNSTQTLSAVQRGRAHWGDDVEDVAAAAVALAAADGNDLTAEKPRRPNTCAASVDAAWQGSSPQVLPSCRRVLGSHGNVAEDAAAAVAASAVATDSHDEVAPEFWDNISVVLTVNDGLASGPDITDPRRHGRGAEDVAPSLGQRPGWRREDAGPCRAADEALEMPWVGLPGK